MVDHSQTRQSTACFLKSQLKVQLNSRLKAPLKAPTWFLVLGLLLSCGCFSGCDLGTYSSRLNDPTPSPAPAEKAMDEKAMDEKSKGKNSKGKKAKDDNDSPNVVGKWEMDNKKTVAAIKKATAGQKVVSLADGSSYVKAIQNGELEFNLAQDGTFTCREVLNGKEENYTGEWVLNGNLLDLNQEFKNGVAERDRFVGSIEGDMLDMTRDQNGLKLPFLFKRSR